MEETAADMAVTLPEDIFAEILFRVKDDPAALFRCTTACKAWRGLIAEPAFLRRCWPDEDARNSSSPFVGFFTQERMGEGISHVPTPCFTPTRRSVLGPGRRTLGSFMTAAPAGLLDRAVPVASRYGLFDRAAPVASRHSLFDRAVPVASRHGLILVRLDTYATRGYPNPIIVDLAVCNLLTGTCHRLPMLKFGSVFDKCKWNGYAILTGADSDDEPVLPTNSSVFKVVIISFYDNDGMNCSSLHTFSSEETSWGVRTNCIDSIVQPTKHWSSSRAVVRRGMAHWLFCDYGEVCPSVLNLNLRTGQISSTKLPFPMGCYINSFLTLSANGALSLFWMQNTGTQLEIWEKKEDQPNNDGGLEWVCRKTIQLKQLGERENEARELCVLGEKSGTLLLNDDTTQGVYTADLETGMMEQVSDWPRRGYHTVPMEVDWPEIFASRLDTRSKRETKDEKPSEVST